VTAGIGPQRRPARRGLRSPGGVVTAMSGARSPRRGRRRKRSVDAQRLTGLGLPPRRGYQDEAVAAIVDGLAGGGRGTDVLACGTGKTLVAAALDEIGMEWDVNSGWSGVHQAIKTRRRAPTAAEAGAQ
jgi:hypothetical protein